MPHNRKEREQAIRDQYDIVVFDGEFNLFNAALSLIDVFVTGGIFTVEYIKSTLGDFGEDVLITMVSQGVDLTTEAIYGGVMDFQTWESPFLPLSDKKVYGPDKYVPYIAARKKQPALPAINRVPLQLYWHDGRGDNFTTASAQGIIDAQAVGYVFARTEGYVQSTPGPGTIPLKLFWHSEYGDNYLTASPEAGAEAILAGYAFVRDECYIQQVPQPGTVPLKTYWHDGRKDYFNTATAQGSGDAAALGYVLVRIEGYVYVNP